jgi:hypothetical protein
VKGKLRGFILSNFLYLILFYVVYFILVPTVKYMKDTTCGLDIFAGYCAAIPTSTNMAMDFMLYVLVPIAAFIVTIVASQEPSYTYTR